jgi:hypothetical protein
MKELAAESAGVMLLQRAANIITSPGNITSNIATGSEHHYLPRVHARSAQAVRAVKARVQRLHVHEVAQLALGIGSEALQSIQVVPIDPRIVCEVGAHSNHTSARFPRQHWQQFAHLCACQSTLTHVHVSNEDSSSHTEQAHTSSDR